VPSIAARRIASRGAPSKSSGGNTDATRSIRSPTMVGGMILGGAVAGVTIGTTILTTLSSTD
jgi:hypothetical protein